MDDGQRKKQRDGWMDRMGSLAGTDGRRKKEGGRQRAEVRDPQITQITPVPSPGATPVK